MAESDHVQLESDLKTTEALQLAASTYHGNRWHVNWKSEDPHPERQCPCFWKKVTRGSLHHLPQSVICIPTHFMQAHPHTFQQGNLITLEGRSGNIWKVRATGKPILHSGWRAFAHDHGLREGDELCFALTQPLHFVVDVFDCHGVVKESALVATNTGKYKVASVCFPYEYVRRPRVRKARKTSTTYHQNSGYGASGAATIASRCKTTVRERSGGYPDYANILRSGHTRKQWECRQEKDGRDVVTILDSDDDEEIHVEKRLLDHMELSFGSAQVQTHRLSNIQQLVAYMKQPGECVPPRSNQAPTTGEDHKAVAIQTTPSPEIAGLGNAAENVDPLHAELTTIQTQVSQYEDTVRSNKEEEEGQIPKLTTSNHDVQLQTNLFTDSKPEVLQFHTISTTSLEADHKCVHIVDKADFLPPATKSIEVVTSRGECLFPTLQNIVNMPLIAAEIMDPIRDHTSIPPESVFTNHELIENQEPVSEETAKEFQSSSATKFQKPRDVSVNGSKPVIPSKTSTTACVLKSKRVPVAKLHRAQTLRAAHAMTKKLRSPTFVAVMKNSNVYADFSLDIPAEFGKKSRLPASEAKVTLVCDEVPTMCKAVWIGTNPEQPKLDAEAWMEFSRSHFLEEGDVCVFELFNRVTIRLGIHIFRVVGLRRSGIPEHWTQHYSVVHLDAHPPDATLALAPVEVKI